MYKKYRSPYLIRRDKPGKILEYFVSASLEVSFFDDPNSQAHCGAADSGFSEYRWECTGLLLKGHKLAAEAAVTVVVVLLATTALSIIVNLKIGLAATAAKGANLVPMAQKWLKNPSSIK